MSLALGNGAGREEGLDALDELTEAPCAHPILMSTSFVFLHFCAAGNNVSVYDKTRNVIPVP